MTKKSLQLASIQFMRSHARFYTESNTGSVSNLSVRLFLEMKPVRRPTIYCRWFSA